MSLCNEEDISFRCTFTVSCGSSSRASNPAEIRVGVPPILRSNRCPRLCAGSVDTRSTFAPESAHAAAVAAETVVLPTPPLPPKNKIFLELASFNNTRCGPVEISPCPYACATRGIDHKPEAVAPRCSKPLD